MATTKRQRQKEARRQKMEAMQKKNKRRQSLRRGVIALVVAILVIGSAALFFTKSSPPTVTIPTTTTTIGTVSTKCSTSAFAVTGFATIACASPGGTSGKAPTMVIPTTAPSKSLEVADLIKGTGAAIKKNDKFTAQYVLGTYSTHEIVQSSWTSTSMSSTLNASSLIPGWVDGLVGMKVGGRREMIIPPSLGYGNTSPGTGIAKNDTLVFIVDLLKIG
jgi:peptidylprolyl isomerase